MPSTAKLSKQSGYDILEPDKVRKFISFALREYGKANKPLKVSFRQYGKTEFLTKWKIKHEGKHVGDIRLKTKTRGVGLGYGITNYVVKLDTKKRDWYAGHCKLVMLSLKSKIDAEWMVGDWWDVRGIPANRTIREHWYDTYQTIVSFRQEQQINNYEEPTLEEIKDHLYPPDYDQSTRIYKDRTLKKIIAAGDSGKLDHLK